jgi:2'-5' RNA ligase
VNRGGRRGDPYAGQPGRRLFIALPLPPAAVDAVEAIVAAVRAEPLPAGMHDVRWVRLDGLHLTLRFLGPTPDERIDPTADAVRAAASVVGTGPIAGALAGAGTFPPHGRPRTLWLGIADGVPAIADVADGVETALLAAGWPADGRPLRPHLTLARCDGLAAGPLVAGRLAAAVGERHIPFVLDRLVLYESLTGGGPARYEPVAEASMGG